MKNLAFLFASMLLSYCVLAQPVYDIKNRDLKAIKQARKEAKKLSKDGYRVAAGALPLEKMLEKSWQLQFSTKESNPSENIYIWADQTAVGETQAAADMQALEFAKINLAGQLETQITSLVEASLANQQLNREEAATAQKVIQASKNLIATTLTNVQPVLKIYRDVPKTKNVECKLMLFYNKEEVVMSAKKTIRKKLAEETEILHDKLDKMLGLDK
jgi:ribosomal protein S2